jgi:hypothetical protein
VIKTYATGKEAGNSVLRQTCILAETAKETLFW